MRGLLPACGSATAARKRDLDLRSSSPSPADRRARPVAPLCFDEEERPLLRGLAGVLGIVRARGDVRAARSSGVTSWAAGTKTTCSLACLRQPHARASKPRLAEQGRGTRDRASEQRREIDRVDLPCRYPRTRGRASFRPDGAREGQRFRGSAIATSSSLCPAPRSRRTRAPSPTSRGARRMRAGTRARLAKHGGIVAECALTLDPCEPIS